MVWLRSALLALLVVSEAVDPIAPHVLVVVPPGQDAVVRLTGHDLDGDKLKAHVASVPASGAIAQLSAVFSDYGYEPKAGPAIAAAGARVTGSNNRLVYTRPEHDVAAGGKWAQFTYTVSDARATSLPGIVTLVPPSGVLVGSRFTHDGDGWTIAGNVGTSALATAVSWEPSSRGSLLNRYVYATDAIINVDAAGDDATRWYFAAPPSYLGNQAVAYGGALEFALAAFSGEFDAASRNAGAHPASRVRRVRLEPRHHRRLPVRSSPSRSTARRRRPAAAARDGRLEEGPAHMQGSRRCEMVEVLAGLTAVRILGDFSRWYESAALYAARPRTAPAVARPVCAQGAHALPWRRTRRARVPCAWPAVSGAPRPQIAGGGAARRPSGGPAPGRCARSIEDGEEEKIRRTCHDTLAARRAWARRARRARRARDARRRARRADGRRGGARAGARDACSRPSSAGACSSSMNNSHAGVAATLRHFGATKPAAAAAALTAAYGSGGGAGGGDDAARRRRSRPRPRAACPALSQQQESLLRAELASEIRKEVEKFIGLAELPPLRAARAQLRQTSVRRPRRARAAAAGGGGGSAAVAEAAADDDGAEGSEITETDETPPNGRDRTSRGGASSRVYGPLLGHRPRRPRPRSARSAVAARGTRQSRPRSSRPRPPPRPTMASAVQVPPRSPCGVARHALGGRVVPARGAAGACAWRAVRARERRRRRRRARAFACPASRLGGSTAGGEHRKRRPARRVGFTRRSSPARRPFLRTTAWSAHARVVRRGRGRRCRGRRVAAGAAAARAPRCGAARRRASRGSPR